MSINEFYARSALETAELSSKLKLQSSFKMRGNSNGNYCNVFAHVGWQERKIASNDRSTS